MHHSVAANDNSIFLFILIQKQFFSSFVPLPVFSYLMRTCFSARSPVSLLLLCLISFLCSSHFFVLHIIKWLMKSKVQPTKPQRSYARASSPELYHKPWTLKRHVHGMINLFMGFIVGVERWRYGWQVLFPVAIPKSEDTVSSPALDLSEN